MTKNNNSFIYEVLDGNNDVMFSGYAPEVLDFLEEPANFALAFWVRQQNDDKKVKCDTWLFLARLVAIAIRDKKKGESKVIFDKI